MSARAVVITLANKHSRMLGRFRREFGIRGIDAFFCHPDKFSVIVDGNEQVIMYDGQVLLRPDFVVTRTGKDPLTVAVIQAMESKNWDVANRGQPILLAVDKGRSMIALKAADPLLPIPKTWIISAHDKIPNGIEFPIVLKVLTGSCARGVMILLDMHQLKAALDMVRVVDLQRRPLLLQEYVGDRPDVALRVIVVDGKALGVMERVSKNGDPRVSITQGAEGIPIKLTPEIASISERATNALGLHWAGIDLLYRGNEFVIVEVNSSPGLVFETVCNVNVVGAIANLVVRRLNARLDK